MDEASRNRIDDLLFAVTQQGNNGVHGLLDAVYGFLQRRTDFYYEAEPGDKMGFPPGIAESMVYSYFRKYQEVHQQRFPPKPETVKRWEEYEKQQKQLKEQKSAQGNAGAAKDEPKAAEPKKVEAKKEEEKKEQPKAEPKVEPKKEQPKKEEPKKVSQSVEDMQKISTYNGDTTEKYDWSQNINEVTVQIPIPVGTTSKQLQVKIEPKRLFVKLKAEDKPLLDGELQEKIKVDDSYWSIEDKKYINITFEKAYEAIWKTVIVGDKEIDPKKVDNSKRLEEFDVETQGHLRKVLYEQERKKQGLPTTEEEEQQKKIAEIMAKQAASGNNMQGGLPYDPSKYGQNPMGSGSGPAIPFRQ